MVDQMFPFLVKNRIPDDPKDKEMAHLGPGSYVTQDPSQQTFSVKALKLKSNLSMSKKTSTFSFLDQTSNKVINVSSQKEPVFGSVKDRFDEAEKPLAKSPPKLGHGAVQYSAVLGQ